MILLSDGRAEKYAYHAEAGQGDESAEEAFRVKTEISTFD